MSTCRRILGSDHDSAPKQPGLYAWYPHFEPQHAAARDAKSFAGWIKERDEQLIGANDVIVTIEERAFAGKWGPSPITRNVPIRTGGSRLERVGDDLEARKSYFEQLNQAVPIFFAPLYVGETDNLHRRLREHAQELARLSEDPPADLYGDLPTSASFAQRAWAHKFPLERLMIYYMVMDPADRNVHPAVREALEFTLNRWSRPVFGVS